MDINAGFTALNGIKRIGSTTTYSSPANKAEKAQNGNSVFETILQSAMNMVNETNALSNMAEEEEINFAMGYTDNFHDLLVAQQKASISLQYTVAVRNAVMDAYKEIMQLQF